jgi:hypothetical protein
MKRWLFSVCAGLFALMVQAQSGRVYDDQQMDVNKNTQWYDTPYFWVGLVVFAVLFIYWLYRRSNRNAQNPLHQ